MSGPAPDPGGAPELGGGPEPDGADEPHGTLEPGGALEPGGDRRAWITRGPIEPGQVLERVGDRTDGAVVLFLGTVRDHNEGARVDGLTYDAYDAMAARVLDEIAGEAAERLGTDRVAVVHRAGELAIGDISVAIAASSPHRAESFDAARYVIEEIKKRLPVWKKEHYVEGGSEWLEGVRPPVGK